jgi:hypothetical protein
LAEEDQGGDNEQPAAIGKMARAAIKLRRQ